MSATQFATVSVSSPRRRGPITPGKSLAKTRRSVLLPNAIDGSRTMGPRLRGDDSGMCGSYSPRYFFISAISPSRSSGRFRP
ncbi:hypothetical protein C7G42_05905 [Bradyrhizobium sp. MOS003]|nr:hypothetical protein C7G42_05905 [Bradyrhizobium sp. MOS003]